MPFNYWGRISYHTLLLIMLIPCVASAMSVQGNGPRLDVQYPIFCRWPLDTAWPERYRDFRGLMIERNESREYYPFLPCIFFDSASALIPDRYIEYDDASQRRGFDEGKIPGGTLEHHYHILNVLGYRMARHRELNLELVGCNSGGNEPGENRQLSYRRAGVVREYLQRIWGIDSSRIRIISRDLPEHPSKLNDRGGNEENRRVEIRSSEWELMKPVMTEDLRIYPQPDSIHFQMQNGIPDDSVASREIEIRRGGAIWHIMRNIGVGDPRSPGYNWGWSGVEDSLPADEQPYLAQLVVHTKGGTELRSNSIMMQVMLLSRIRKIQDRLIDKTVDNYSTLIFGYNNAQPGPTCDRTIRTIICDSLRPGAHIMVIGHDDGMLPDARSLLLSSERSAAVASIIKREARGRKDISTEEAWVGPESPLYSNDRPEGRFFNRTVTVTVTTAAGK